MTLTSLLELKIMAESFNEKFYYLLKRALEGKNKTPEWSNP